MYDQGLAHFVEGPTRFSSSSASQLDLMFIDNSYAVSDCLILPPIADRCPTLLQLQLNVEPAASYDKRRHRNFFQTRSLQAFPKKVNIT